MTKLTETQIKAIVNMRDKTGRDLRNENKLRNLGYYEINASTGFIQISAKGVELLDTLGR